MLKKKQKTNDSSTTDANWLMLTTPEAKPFSSTFLRLHYLTKEAVISLIENEKAVYVPRAFDEMIECATIEFEDCTVICEGGLHFMILQKVKDIIILDKWEAHKLSSHLVPFSVFYKLLQDFLVIWKIDDSYSSTILRSFEAHYSANFSLNNKKALSLSEEYNILWKYINNLCFDDLKLM